MVTEPKPEAEPPAEECVEITPGEPSVEAPAQPEPAPPAPEPLPPAPEHEAEPQLAPVPPSPPEPPASPPPSLAPMLLPEEESRYRNEINASLARSRRNLAVLARRNLSQDQQIRLNRVRTFIAQAEAVRATDLAAAAGLARRADILSAELVNATE